MHVSCVNCQMHCNFLALNFLDLMAPLQHEATWQLLWSAQVSQHFRRTMHVGMHI